MNCCQLNRRRSPEVVCIVRRLVTNGAVNGRHRRKARLRQQEGGHAAWRQLGRGPMLRATLRRKDVDTATLAE